MSAAREYFLTINGQLVKGEASFGVINPATGQVFAQAADASKEQMNAAVAAAKEAYKTWSVLPLAARQDFINKIADGLQSHHDEISRLLVQEQGKSLGNAQGELNATIMICRDLAKLDIPRKTLSEDATSKLEAIRRSLGVVVGITPWNFPVLICIQKMIPAILCGNTVIVKPSPFTPLTTLLIGEIANKVLPPGVASCISGGNDLGAWLVDHPDVAKISFTGSVLTGQKIQGRCAEQVKRCTLELGGNDAAIILPDVDPTKAAPAVFGGAFANTGQVCCAIKRIFVHESRYDEWCQALVSECQKHKFGNGLDEGVEFGPLNNKMQFDRVSELVEDAKQKGAQILCGGSPIAGSQGYFYQPTIIAGVQEGVRIVDEEQFGPAVPILKYTTEAEAIDRANNTRYGLGGSIWSNDQNKAAELALKMDAGTVWINQHIAPGQFKSPFGGRKYSGIGREGGEYYLEEYTEACTISTSKVSF